MKKQYWCRLIQTSILFALASCRTATQFSATGPEPDAANRDGLRYYLARDVLLVDADVTFRRGTTWAKRGPQEPCAVGVPFNVWQSTRWRVTPLTLPDRTEAFRLGITPGSAVQKALNVTVSDAGLLVNLNYSGHDQTGEIVGSVLKGIASAAGALSGLPLAVAGAEERVAPSDTVCFRESGLGNETEERIKSTSLALEQTHALRIQLLGGAAQAQNTSTLRSLRARDSILGQRENMLAQDLATLRGMKASQLAAFLKKRGVGEADTVVHLQYALDVGTIPSALPGRTLQTARNALATGTPARILLDSARMVIVAATIPAAERNRPTQTASSIGCTGAEGKGCARIYFRTPTYRMLEVYTPAVDKEGASLMLRERTVAPLVASTDPRQSIAFEGRRFTNAGLKIALGRYGNVTTLEQSSGAALAGATSAVASALTSARQEYLASLKSVHEMQTTTASIRENRLTSRVRELKSQKEVIDAEVALRGARASQDLLAQKQQIDTELQLLQSQQALSTAQAGAERATDTAEIRDEIERLKVQVQLLQQQLELEKARAALRTAQPGS
jgi:hypothetical protein